MIAMMSRCQSPAFVARARAALPHVFAALLLLSVHVGCHSPSFSVKAPPIVPVGRVSPPEVPEAQPVKLEPIATEAAKVVTHKTREVPDLRGRLVALVRLSGDEQTALRLEDALTPSLVDKGVTRLIPGGALAEVNGTLDRPEGAARGSVKLTARLGSLSLIGQASGADYVVYGDISAGAQQGETREVPFEIPAAELQAYQARHASFASELRNELKRVRGTCEEALASFDNAMEQYKRDGGTVGLERGIPSAAMQAERQYATFRSACAQAEEALRASGSSVPTPQSLAQAAKRKKGSSSAQFTSLTAVIKLRQASTDETFWIGRFSVRAGDLEGALQILADKLVSELSSHWSAEPPPVEAEKNKPGRRTSAR